MSASHGLGEGLERRAYARGSATAGGAHRVHVGTGRALALEHADERAAFYVKGKLADAPVLARDTGFSGELWTKLEALAH